MLCYLFWHQEKAAMPYDLQGRKIRVRGRQLYVTMKDIAAFSRLVEEAIPDVRFHDDTKIREGEFPEVSGLDAINHEVFGAEVTMLFYRDPWQPEFEPHTFTHAKGGDGIWYSLSNLPSTLVSLWGGCGTERVEIPEIGRTVDRLSQGLLNANNLVDDPWAKKIVDKVFRLSGKVLFNREYAVDLVSGEVVEEQQRAYNWIGYDAARQCHERDDLFLYVTVNRQEGRFWGYLPAKA